MRTYSIFLVTFVKQETPGLGISRSGVKRKQEEGWGWEGEKREQKYKSSCLVRTILRGVIFVLGSKCENTDPTVNRSKRLFCSM